MIKVYCQESDEYKFVNCFSGDRTNKFCIQMNDNCSSCPYAEENVEFIQHDSERIMMEVDEEYDLEACFYDSPYNFLSCGMVNPNTENCDDCRFWYENIEVDKIKKG